MDWNRLENRLEQMTGRISFYYENLITGERFSFHGSEPMMAASIIKLYIMADAFGRMERGELDPEQKLAMRKEDYVPSCGAVAYLHEGVELTVMDLITLMIIFSDNTATNVLIDLLGLDEIQAGIEALGFSRTVLRRKMYDLEKSRRGIQNQITAEEVGRLLRGMYDGSLISRRAGQKMLSIMKNQQVNGKIPFYLQALPEEPEIAHKTGEDFGITHDAGIIYGMQPFIVCFCGNETDTPAFERVMAETALELYREQFQSEKEA